MFDWEQHGRIGTHHYRSYFDAHPGSTNKCAYCGRVIRFCYALHDQHEKTFLIGSCDFYHYKGETYKCLKAAQVLLEGTNAAESGQNSGSAFNSRKSEPREDDVSNLERRKRNASHKR